MALNWAMLTPNRSPIPLPHEQTITTVETGVDIMLNIPDSPPADSATAGGSGGTKKHQASGGVWVTDQRFIFVSKPDSTFESITVPLHSILATRFEQPTFGANYLAFDVKPSGEGSGLSDGTTIEVRFKDRAMFEFVALLEKTRERAIYMKRQAQSDSAEEGLPTYTSPTQGNSSVSMMDGIPVDNPPGYAA
ncbi:hypothetical protein C8J56DRAFT_939643 [Mycena floridula]|nr:hypothetical protein C8J56DRAFT_945676 [Mycena floridula]KAJ7588574.1 hypothetical protein C8J56DRAFT_939643 [Mycena floridula]